MQPLNERSFDIQELKEYFFCDRQLVEEFDVEQMRNRLEELLNCDIAL